MKAYLQFNFRLCVLGMCLFSWTFAQAQTATEAWVRRYNDPPAGADNRGDRPYAIAVDHSSGNVIVAGEGNSDYVTIAYSEAGMALWTNRYDGPGNNIDRVIAVAVDARGNVVVTGGSQGDGSNTDYATIAYSASGVPLWTNRYNGLLGNGVDRARAVGVDRSGNVFVTGYSEVTDTDTEYVTIAYSPAGMALWTNHHNAGENSQDWPYALALDRNGNVFVTGGDTIAYSGAGVALWTNRYPAGHATDVAVDHQGNVFVTGSSSDFVTLAYSPAGTPLWTNRYDGPANGQDLAQAIAVDQSGNVFVTGYSVGIGSSSDYATIAYSGAGVALWTNRYNGPANGADSATSIAADRDGNVFVTGLSGSWPSSDYATIAYSAGGVALWTNYYNGPANGPDIPMAESWIPGSWLAIGRDGAVYVTGSSDGDYSDFTAYDYATVKYVWRPHLAIEPLAPGSSTVNLSLSAPTNSSWSIQRALTPAGPWTDLRSSLTGPNGSASFTDPNPTANGAFYRVAP